MALAEALAHGAVSRGATALSASAGSTLCAASRALLEKLRSNDSKRGAAGKWAEIKNGLFRVSTVGGGGPGAPGAPQSISSSSSAMLQRGQEDHKQITKKCVEELRKHAPVTSLEMFQEKLEECARNVVNADTNTPMQFTVQNKYDVFISSDTFYVEVKMNPRARTEPASVLLNDGDTPSGPQEPLVNAVRIYHTDDPISCGEMVSLLNEENFTELTIHLKGLMSIYDNFQSESVNRSKIWLSLRALEEDLDVLAQIQGTSSFLKHDVSSLVLRAPVGVLSPRVGGRPLTLTYFVSPYDLLDAEKKEVIPWSLDTLAAKKLGRRVTVAIEAIPSSTMMQGRSDPNCHRLQHMALLTIKTNAEGKKIPSFASLTPANSSILAARFALRLDDGLPSVDSASKRDTVVTTTSPLTAVPMAEELVKTVLGINYVTSTRMYESSSTSATEAKESSRDLIPMIVEQELRRQSMLIDPKAKIEPEALTYKYFGSKNEVGQSRSTPPLKVYLPNQTHTYIFNNISTFHSLETLPRKSLLDDPLRKTSFSGFLVGGVAFTHPTSVPQILALLRTQLVFNTVIASCVRIPGSNIFDSKLSSSTSHVFEVQALSLYRLSISFEVEEDDDFDGLEEDEELMRQLEEEMVDTMSGEAGGLVSAEINLKEMGQATCVLAGSVDPSLLPTNEFATKVLNKTLSIPITMRAIVKRCLELQRERKQKKIKKIRDILNARAKAAAEAAVQAMRQKQIQQQQQEKTARVMTMQQSTSGNGPNILSGVSSQDNDVVITGPPTPVNEGPSNSGFHGFSAKASMSQPPRPMSMHASQQQQQQQQQPPPPSKSNDQLLLNLLNSNNSPTNKAKPVKGGKKRKALSSLDMGIPPGGGPQEDPPGGSFGTGKSPKQRRIDGSEMDDSPFSMSGSSSHSPYEFPEGGNNMQQSGVGGGMAGPSFPSSHPQAQHPNAFRGMQGSRPPTGSSYGADGGSQQQMMPGQQQMNNPNFGGEPSGGMPGQGAPGQQTWGQQSKFPGGPQQQGMNPPMNARNQQNPQNFQTDHFLGDGRSASTVAPKAAATSSSDVDRDLVHKGGNKGSNASSLASTPNIFKNSALTNRSKTVLGGTGNIVPASSAASSTASTTAASAASFLAQLAAKKDVTPPSTAASSAAKNSSKLTSSNEPKSAGGDCIDLTDDADDDVLICQDSTPGAGQPQKKVQAASTAATAATSNTNKKTLSSAGITTTPSVKRSLSDIDEVMKKAKKKKDSLVGSQKNNNGKKQQQRAGSIERDMTIEWNKETGGVTTMPYSASDPGSRTPPYNPTKASLSSTPLTSSSMKPSLSSSANKVKMQTLLTTSTSTTTPKTKTVSPIKIRTTPEGIITASSVQPSKTSQQAATGGKNSLPSYSPSGRSSSPNVSLSSVRTSSSSGSRSAPSSANTSPALSSSKSGSGGQKVCDLQSNNLKKTPTVKLKPLSMPSSISSSLSLNKSASAKSVSPSLNSVKTSGGSGAGNKGSMSAPAMAKSGKNSPNLVNKKSAPSAPLTLPAFQPSLPAGLKFTKIKQPVTTATSSATPASTTSILSSSFTTTTTTTTTSSSNLPRSGSNATTTTNNNKPFGPSPAATASMLPLPPPLPIAPGTSVKTKPPKGKFYGPVVSAPPSYNHSAKGQNVFSTFSDVFDDESNGNKGQNSSASASQSEPPKKNIPSLLSTVVKPVSVSKPAEEKVLKGILKTSADRSGDLGNRPPVSAPSSTEEAGPTGAPAGGGGVEGNADEDAKRDSFENSFLNFISTKENDGGKTSGVAKSLKSAKSPKSPASDTSAVVLEEIDEIASPEMLQDRFSIGGAPVVEISLHEKLTKPPASPANLSSVGSRSTTPLIPINANNANILDDDDDDDDEKDSLVIDCGAGKTPPSAGRSSFGGGNDAGMPALTSPDGVGSSSSETSATSSSSMSSASMDFVSANAKAMTAVVSASKGFVTTTTSNAGSGLTTNDDQFIDEGLLC